MVFNCFFKNSNSTLLCPKIANLGRRVIIVVKSNAMELLMFMWVGMESLAKPGVVMLKLNDLIMNLTAQYVNTLLQ